jgi:SagB-type dehydrogenase family enzyme
MCAGVLTMTKDVVSWAQGLPSDQGAASGTDALASFNKDGGMPLEKAFLERKSTKAYNPDRKLTREEISRILWAAGGVNRANGKRIVSSAMGKYPVDILAALPDGVFLYEYKEHKLKKLLSEDIRTTVVTQAAFKQAAMIVLYVINKDIVPSGKLEYADMEIGGMGQNIYLEAGNLGLGACIFAGISADAAAKALSLKETQIVRIGQAVGGAK